MNTIENIDTSSILDKELLETIVQEYARISKFIWYKFSQCINITKHSKVWWNKECYDKLTRYRSFKTIENWKIFKGVIKKTKHCQMWFTLGVKVHEVDSEICRLMKQPWL